jgi:MFS transporter, Spinster family, sphingosine-1-phosphate transporter
MALVRKNYLLVLLTIIVACNYVDRLALGIMLEDIKADLALTDTQLGFLTGMAFALFYAVMGIPIARWADRGNRVTIIGITTALWSAAVALCGVAGNFVQLMLIRVGVAVGEAGCHPPALSLLSDYFNRAERPRAVSLYLLGWPVALIVGNAAAGWLNEWYGWRTTFVILGLPGVIIAALAGLTLKEPRKLQAMVADSRNTPSTGPVSQPSLKQVFVTLWSTSAFRHVLVCQSLVAFFAYGLLQWQPAFFVRSHGLDTGELGTWMAFVYGVGGLLGTWLGGEVASRYASNNERLQLRGIAVLLTISAGLMMGVYLAPNHHLAFALLGVNAIVGSATNGPLFATTQTLVPARMRAISAAITLFFANLIGMGFGPVAVGTLSDGLRPWLGEESLRYALVVFGPGYVWCAWHAWRAGHTASEVAAAQVNASAEAIRLRSIPTTLQATRCH